MTDLLGLYDVHILRIDVPPKNAATVCGSAAPYRQLKVKKGGEHQSIIWQLKSALRSSNQDLQLVDIIVFDVDVEVVLLQQAVYAEFQFADVLLDLVVINTWEQET